IVIIATYPSSHLPLLKECLAAGKHVLCEKPISTSLQEGEEFVRLVKENPQCKVLVGHILRHNRSYQQIAEMIQSDVIGHPIIFRMVQNHHTMNWNRYLSLIRNTSPIVDCGVHYIDVIEWFTGSRVQDVTAAGMRTEESVPENRCNYGIMTLKLEDGSVGYYEAGWSNTLASDNLKEFAGPKGRIRLIYRKDRQMNQEEGDLIELYHYPEQQYETINLQSDRKPTGAQFDHLIRMIETDCPAVPSIDQVLHCFKVTLKAEQLAVGKQAEKR
ncbi:MAG: Gfo/Idh/MocA family oxidoreductase, partial [Firmicutes bacterium]|nr:Gfo/Idh/MocA family oxidoreductase [Bacillota bacterium]